MRSLIQDLFTVKTDQLYNMDDLLLLTEKYKGLTYTQEEIPHFKTLTTDNKIVQTNIGEELQNHFPEVYDVLVAADGQISLCGGSIVSILFQQDIKDFDIFFHCQTVEKADKLLAQSMELLKGYVFYTTQAVETVELGYPHEIQFIRRVYQNKAQILKGFDLAPSRLGWNPVDGFFGTIDGLMAIATKCFPIDTKQRSLSFDKRLLKYSQKGFNILFPGWKLTEDFECVNECFDYKDGKFVAHIDYSQFKDDVSDYQVYKREYANYYILYLGRFECLKLDQGKDWKPIQELPDDAINFKAVNRRPNINDYETDYNATAKINLSLLRSYFKDNFQKFFDAKLAGKEALCKKLWDQQKQYYIDLAPTIMSNIKANPWKYENPDSQHFGKFNPIVAHPSDWYGDNYQPVYAGINDDYYVLLKQMGKILPDAEFREVMDKVLINLSEIAMENIFGCNYDLTFEEFNDDFNKMKEVITDERYVSIEQIARVLSAKEFIRFKAAIGIIDDLDITETGEDYHDLEEDYERHGDSGDDESF